MKKFFVVSVLCVLLGSGFGCNNYRVPEYKSLNQDMVTEDQVYRYEVGEVMRENRLFYKNNIQNKEYDIEFKDYEELEAKCHEFYTALKKRYSSEALQIGNILEKQFPQFYLEVVFKYLDTEILFSKYVDEHPISEFIDTDSLSTIVSLGNCKVSFKSKKITDSKTRTRLYYRDIQNHINLGEEIILVELNGRTLTIKRPKESEINGIQINKFYHFITSDLGKDEDFYKVYFNLILSDKFSGETKEIADKFQTYNQRASLLHQINNNDLRCLIIKKDVSFFEEKNDLSIGKISMVQYKENQYLTINVIYLNVFNNINIKLNDQYKIARYLYDHLIRKGIREFSDTYEISDIDGLCFKILATDKNFIDDKGTSNFSAYEFYMPKKECLLYINDDITGQDLASSSYILVNGERIELR
jgi:hypothetical protein